MLYDSAARAGEALGLDVPGLDLANRQARARTKGGHTRPLHFQTAAARLLARLTAGRQVGPVFLTARRAAAHRVMAAADLEPGSGRARLSYEMAGQLFKRYSGGKTLHQLRHSRLTHLGDRNVSAPLLMAVSGHKPLPTLQRYVKPSQAAVAALMVSSNPDRRGRVPDPSGARQRREAPLYRRRDRRHLDQNHAQRQPDKSTRPRPVTRPGDSGATSSAITPAAADTAVARARPQRRRSGLTPAALACPACGHQAASRPEALRQREDLAIVWLHQDSPSGPISQHRHCASCQPHAECGTVECAYCGDGPVLTGTLVDQFRKRDPNQPTALRAWRTSRGWQLEPEPLCPAHSISVKD